MLWYGRFFLQFDQKDTNSFLFLNSAAFILILFYKYLSNSKLLRFLPYQ